MSDVLFSMLQIAVVFTFGMTLRMTLAMSQSSDQWGVYSKLRKLSDKRWIDYSMPDALPRGAFPYPMLVHFLVSRLPERMWKPVIVLTNLGSDLLVAALVLWISRTLLADLPGQETAALDTATLSALAFLTMPILLPITARMRDSNGRAVGLVLHTAYLLCVYLAWSENILPYAPLGVLVLLAIFLTSFFAMQSSLFFSVGLALYLRSPLPLAMAAVAVLIAFLAPRLGARDTLVFKINHFIWYWRNAQKNTTATNRNLIRNFLRFFAVLLHNRQEALGLFYRFSPLLIALYSVPAFWILGLTCLDQQVWAVIQAHPFMLFCIGTSITATVLFLLTSLGRLVIFGESERYFEYGAPFTCMILPIALTVQTLHPGRVLLLLSLFQATVVLFNEMTYTNRFFRWLFDEPLHEAKEEQAVMRRLQLLGDGTRVATVPIKLPILLTAFNNAPSSLSFYYRFIMQGNRLDGFRYYEEDTEDINVFSGTPERLARRYGITHVLCQQRYLKPGLFRFLDALLDLKPFWEGHGYALYAIEMTDENQTQANKAPLAVDTKETGRAGGIP